MKSKQVFVAVSTLTRGNDTQSLQAGKISACRIQRDISITLQVRGLHMHEEPDFAIWKKVLVGSVGAATILSIAIPSSREAAYQHLANTFEEEQWHLSDPFEGTVAAASIAHALGAIADDSTGAIAAYGATILYHYQP